MRLRLCGDDAPSAVGELAAVAGCALLLLLQFACSNFRSTGSGEFSHENLGEIWAFACFVMTSYVLT